MTFMLVRGVRIYYQNITINNLILWCLNICPSFAFSSTVFHSINCRNNLVRDRSSEQFYDFSRAEAAKTRNQEIKEETREEGGGKDEALSPRNQMIITICYFHFN
jgi:hypothetical protein